MPQVVGLDIGTSAVRAAEIETNGGRPALLAFSQVGLPPGVIVDGEVHDGAAVSDAIARLWKNGKFTSKSVIVGVAGLRAITREFDLPWVPDDEVDSAVRFQSEEIIPFPPDKTILSAQVLSDFEAPDGTSQRRVLVAAAHRELIDGIVEAVERAGLHVDRVDLVSSALVRALVDSVPEAQQPEAIVSVGAGLTVIVVHQQGRPQFVRTIGMGSNLATNAISSALDLPFADAEAIKRRLGSSETRVQSAERAVQPTIAELVGEIRNSIQYFASLPGRSPISSVTITGAGAQLRGLVEQLQSQVRIPIHFVSPLSRLDLSGFDLSPEQAASIEHVLAAPIGLALPEPNSAVKFNLVPPEVLLRDRERQLLRYSLIGAGVVVVILAGVSVWRFLQVHSAQNDVAALHTSVASLNAQIPLYDKVVRANQELHLAQGQIAHLDQTAVNWPAVLAELATRAPSGLSVTSFSGTAQSSTTSGASSAPSTPGASTSATVGTISVAVSGTYPASVHFDPVAEWIDSITASSIFDPPNVSGVTNSPASGGTTVSFQSTVALKSGSLVKKASS